MIIFIQIDTSLEGVLINFKYLHYQLNGKLIYIFTFAYSIHQLRKSQQPISMKTRNTDEATMKKLMKIIYDKQKQIDKYKKLIKLNKVAVAQHPSKQAKLIQKQKYNKRDPQQYVEHQNQQYRKLNKGPNCHQQKFNKLVQKSEHLSETFILTNQQKLQITRQIIENRNFLETASIKLAGMESKMYQLHNDLEEEQSRNYILEQQIKSIKQECQDKQRQILQLKTIKQILQKQNFKLITANNELLNLLHDQQQKKRTDQKQIAFESYGQDQKQQHSSKPIQNIKQNKIDLVQQSEQRIRHMIQRQPIKQQIQKQNKVQKLIVENKKVKIISEQVQKQNKALKQRIRNLQQIVTKQFKTLSRSFRSYYTLISNGNGNKIDELEHSICKTNLNIVSREFNNSSVKEDIKSNPHLQIRYGKNSMIKGDDFLGSNRCLQERQSQIRTVTEILGASKSKINRNLQQKIGQFIEIIKQWEQLIKKKQQDWRMNFQKSMLQHSFDGISNLIGQSVIIKNNQLGNIQRVQQALKTENIIDGSGNRRDNNGSNFYQSSIYKRNQQQLLKQLQRQCQKQMKYGMQIQMDKQKLVELSEIKQSLKMTKQVNEQLFDELNKKQNIINVCKQTIKKLQQKKLVKQQSQGKQYLRKLRGVLGVLN